MPASMNDGELKYWYFVIRSGGVESGDTSTEMPEGARMVETLEEMTIQVDIWVDRQVEQFEAEFEEIALITAEEDGESEEDGELEPCPVPLQHHLFSGMGAQMQAKLKAAGVTTIEQLKAHGVDGLVSLKISGLTRTKAKQWVARAEEILAAV